jgi:hypothetical protein
MLVIHKHTRGGDRQEHLVMCGNMILKWMLGKFELGGVDWLDVV